MDVIGWLLVACFNSHTCVTLPTQYPNEGLCRASAKAAYVQTYFGGDKTGLTDFICIPGHSPLHGGKEG